MTAAAKILMLGATGTAGRATAQALVDAGHSVVALGRRDPDLAGVAFHRADVQEAEALTAAFAQIKPRAVVSCLASRTGAPADAWAIDHGAHLNVLRAAQDAGTKHFVLLSAICVQKPRLAFQHAKLAFEAALVASGLTYSIVRPTALFKSLSGQLARVQTGKPYLMFGDGTLTACKPISDRDLGAFMASCLRDPARQNRILPIGGPGPALTPRAMGDALFDLTGQPPKFRKVPLRLLRLIEGTLRMGGTLRPALAAKADLAQIGQYYASESMLVWDAENESYNVDATPEFGTDTLFDFYKDLIAGTATIDLDAHKVF